MNNRNNGYDSSRPSVLWLYALMILSALMGSTISLVLNRVILPNPHLATVDMTGLMVRFVQSEANESASLVQKRAEVRAFSQHLETVLKEIAHEKHLILVPKEAVITGSQDVTAEVSARLSLLQTHSPALGEKSDALQ